MIDARNNQVYCGIFDNNKNLLEEYIADDILVVIPKLEKYNNIIFVGDGQVLHRQQIEEKLKNKNIEFWNENNQSGKSCGICGYKKYLKAQDVKNYNTLNPIYLRKSQAERLKNK